MQKSNKVITWLKIFKPSDLRLPLEDEEKLVAEAIQMVSRSGKFVSRRSDAKIK